MQERFLSTTIAPLQGLVYGLGYWGFRLFKGLGEVLIGIRIILIKYFYRIGCSDFSVDWDISFLLVQRCNADKR